MGNDSKKQRGARPLNSRSNHSGAIRLRQDRPSSKRHASGKQRHALDDTQLDDLFAALTSLQDGNFAVRLELGNDGARYDQIATAFNAVASLCEGLTNELVRVERVVGREGRLQERARLEGARGTWTTGAQALNNLIGDLMQPTTEVARVITAVASGDFTRKMAMEFEGQPVQGEFLRIGTTVNAMVEQLSSFAAEVTRVAREVGTEGMLGGQAFVPKAAGSWRDLTDNVNHLASNLTVQVRNIAEVTTSVANGDLSKKITVDAKGEILELKNTINTMVDQLNSFASEVTRVAREVGTDGKLGGQAVVKGVSGVWKDLTDNVNYMASNLTTQVRGIARVVTAVANGDLSQRFKVEAKGEIAALADTINAMTITLGLFAEQVTDVARTVGVEGKLGAQAEVPGVAGTWKDLTDNVNLLANNLTAQVRNIAEVTTSVAKGDLSKKITVDARGEILELKNTINTMVDQLNSFASEVTRVAKEVGTDGKLGGQAEVQDVSGVWKGLTDNVNFMARNLTDQVRNIAKVSIAIANGDLSQKITVEALGEILELKNTINTMVDQLRSFAGEVTRVAREVGTEGKLGGQAVVQDVSGVWKDLTDNVNYMASNLTTQVRGIIKVVTAVANGDLTQKLEVPSQGEIAALGATLNNMTDTLGIFAEQVTSVARTVGVEGKLGAQAEVPGVAGTWKDLTNNVNLLANNLTAQVRDIANVATAVANGDLSQKITVDVRGEILELKNTINTMVDQLRSFAGEVTRVAKEVGTDGKLGGQAEVPGVSGVWKGLTDNVNFMARNLTDQVRNIAKVSIAIANGDLSQKITVEALGEILELKNTINTMVDQLRSFAGEVTRVAREVGTEGKLGGQAVVKDVSGVWKDLTDNVNFMASNLTTQVRGIVRVVTAVANGDLGQKLAVEAKGEVAALADTINAMTDTLGTFAEQVTTVAREVGIEGKLGGQAKVPGAMGTWRQLTDNVNQLAANLTTQVRAIADVATAVTKGDLTRSITVNASGEVAALKDNINQMIVNLKETTQKNAEQDWLKTNLAKFGGMMQGQKDLEAVSRLIMSELTPLVSAQHGAFFLLNHERNAPVLRLLASYAYRERKNVANRFAMGEGLVGQCALEKKPILLTKVPSDYIQISSGLGEAPPLNIIVLPVLFEGEVKAVIELASLYPFSAIHQLFLDQLTESIGVVLNMISANMRTEELLQQSQNLTQELRSQSDELTVRQQQLTTSNAELEKQAAELEDKAKLLEEQNRKVEIKNSEVEQARLSLEEKAEQLSLISKYKSEFLANMSHELRTPLNSLLILAKLLSDNKEGNLSPKQTEYAKTIYASGGDLLSLINEILDLAKVESGKMEVDAREVPFDEIKEYADRTFRPLADEKGLHFETERESGLPRNLYTDPKRLQQILKNLLANAIKFTAKGQVTLRLGLAPSDMRYNHPALQSAARVISFAVNDTGIGIPADKQKVIFEAFQQADGTTSRKYGGTGLGLSISRELARLLGGEIHVVSQPGAGSTFTLYLPDTYKPGEPQKQEEPLYAPALNEELELARGPLGAPSPEHQFEPGVTIVPIEPPDPSLAAPIEDDRQQLKEGDRVLLVIEDDLKFARILMSLAREKGFKVVVADRGDTGLVLASELVPSAITLDIRLPAVDGWSVLDRLKRNPLTRHIPVHVITVLSRSHVAAEMGAFSFLEKPVSKEALDGSLAHLTQFLDRRVRRLLVVEDNPQAQKAIAALLEGPDVEVTAAGSAEEALSLLEQREFDCMVLDLVLPGLDGTRLLERLKTQERFHELPVVVFTGHDLTPEESHALRRYAEAVILKSSTLSYEQLLDQTALFLHRVETKLSQETREMLDRARGADPTLAGLKVLVVDDDARNIFALMSILEDHNVELISASSGREAIDLLRKRNDIDMVLMDIMMPEMDGYETTRAIRQIPELQHLPVIALTAKALAEDRERCLAAGASDYLPKPFEPERLLELIRYWTRKPPRTGEQPPASEKDRH